MIRAHLRGCLMLAAAVVAVVCGNVKAATYWVAPCGNDGWAGIQGACVAPLGPKRTIQAAINIAAHGDTIHVLPGVYEENIDLLGLEITLLGLGGSDATYIDGGDAGTVVMCNSLESNDTIIDGFTIQNGHAMEGGGMFIALSAPVIRNCAFRLNSVNVSGGAVLSHTSAPTFENCVFEDNHASYGGGAYIRGGSASFVDCEFTSNHANIAGGAVQTGDSADCVITGSLFAFNDSFDGGAINAAGGSINIDDCTFNSNEATDHAGALDMHNISDATVSNSSFTGNVVGWEGDGQGGAIRMHESSPVIVGCTFHQNSAAYGGGGIALRDSTLVEITGCTFTENANTQSNGGAALDLDGSTAIIFGSSFNNNQVAQFGGAIYAASSSMDISLCGFNGNTAPHAEGSGAAMRLRFAVAWVTATTFVDNSSGGGGGGAVQMFEGGASFDGCLFQGNSDSGNSGGAILARQTHLEMTECTFDDNYATEGGAIAARNCHEVEIEDSTFVHNVATLLDGGAFFGSNGPAIFQSCVFNDNMASESGGAIAVTNVGHLLELTEVSFHSNSSTIVGGAVSTDGPTSIVGSGFTQNTSTNGGGLAIAGPFGDVSVHASRFAHNFASDAGGAILNGGISSGSDLTLVNSIVTDNTSVTNLGAIHETVLGAFTRIVNCVVASNEGGGIRINNGASQSVVDNSIVRGNTGGAEIGGVMPLVRHCNVEGGVAGFGNMDVDPMFVNPAIEDYSLQAGSPCIDAGANLLLPADVMDIDNDLDVDEFWPWDFAGAPRYADDPNSDDLGCGGIATVDIGPYEFTGDAIDDLQPGDVNADGVVDVVDLLDVLAAWGPCPEACCPADLNVDGVVDVEDLLIVLAFWG